MSIKDTIRRLQTRVDSGRYSPLEVADFKEAITLLSHYQEIITNHGVLPAFAIVGKDGKVVTEFHGYGELYQYVHEKRKDLIWLTQVAEVVMRFGETPMRYDEKTGKVYHISFDAADLQFVLPPVWWKEIGNAR